ncbi:MAG: radical SAM protein, partial [Firmicutes bacterium]|nr:radical SAM protein [Bacillota bacterium]
MEVKYKIFTYGCQMNVHDSERIAGALEQHGFSATDSECEADIIVFNTCCIRHTAEKRILGNIGDIKHLKKKNKNLIVAVAGCMTQQEGVPESLRTQFPFVDVCAGTGKAVEFADKIKAVYDSVVSETKRGFHNLPADLSSESVCEGEPVARTSFPHAWINIIYGCDNFCSYCIVPFVRGRERSRAPEAILQEVEGLLKAGYTKITLLGQNVNSYSYENDSGKWDFAMLLEAVASLNYNFTVGFM